MEEQLSRKREEQGQRPWGGSVLEITEEEGGVDSAGNKGEINSR